MATQAGKARQTGRASDSATAPKAKVLARSKPAAPAEVVDKATRGRFEAELDGAIKRKPSSASEAKLAGALRAVAALSPGVRAIVAEATEVLVRRGSYGREIYGASIRSLAEGDDRRTTALLKSALGSDEAGGSATLSAACFCKDPTLAPQLAKVAASRQSHLAFGAETARVARAESNGAHLVQLAPMIKESHRIALCSELFVPLARGAPIPVHVSPALAVLRGAERHLGRWLVLADVAAKAGDRGPLEEATQRANAGPSSARAAWSLVAWALTETAALAKGEEPPPPPETRPTVELVARLSDRPSADRDTTFLFRMARARAPGCRAMLEALVKTPPLLDEVAVRAALYLARDHGREDMLAALLEAAKGGPVNGGGAPPAKRDELRGLAVAALWDAGDRDNAVELAGELVTSRVIGNVAWSALVRAAAARASTSGVHAPVLGETPLRWIQWSWLE